ncbi:prepilin-type N-terminal cleavage/methylation domain-containing protein [candidate division WWE3 bacterium]|nr:prepilin-type N-terminal cleavage/methylation domain-containing protein [candidate division WWE3 bacterium]
MQQSVHGYTFVELLIVVSLITILAGAAIPGFTNYTRNQNLKQSTAQLKDSLRSAQNNALGGLKSADAGVGYWGVQFADGTNAYDLYTFSEALDSFSKEDTFDPLIGDIEVKNSNVILFDMFTGNAYTTGGSPATPCDANGSNCFVIIGESDATGAECVSILANTPGGLLVEEGVTCP